MRTSVICAAKSAICRYPTGTYAIGYRDGGESRRALSKARRAKSGRTARRPTKRRVAPNPPPASLPASPPRPKFSRYPRQPVRIDVHRHQLLQVGLPLRDQRGFASRRRAGIQYPQIRPSPREKRRTARPSPAPRPFPPRIPAMPALRRANPTRWPKAPSLRRARRSPRSEALRDIRRRWRSRLFDPQPHRRLRIAGRQQLGPTHRPIGAKSIRQPDRRRVPVSGRRAISKSSALRSRR